MLCQVLSNIDELFDRAEFSAAPDPGWPDCFNSGVFVFQPSLETHGLLLRHAVDHGSFDGKRGKPDVGGRERGSSQEPYPCLMLTFPQICEWQIEVS